MEINDSLLFKRDTDTDTDSDIQTDGHLSWSKTIIMIDGALGACMWSGVEWTDVYECMSV